MFISLNWLRDYVGLPKNLDARKLADLLTVRSAEVETVNEQSQSMRKIVVGKVLKVDEHPSADRLRVAQVDVGQKKAVQVVCGGINLKAPQWVAVALPGAVVKWHGEEVMEMKDAEIRGVKSHGMICAAEEIGLPAGGEKEILDLSEILGDKKVKAGGSLAELLKLDDLILEFDNKALTHRPDLWGHRGMAREISAILETKFKDRAPKVSFAKGGKSPAVKVEDAELCPRYMAVLIRGVKVKESPEWLKAALQKTDHSIFNNIVDVTNYVMEDIGQPLHAFDLRKIKKGIVVRRAKKDEKLTLLTGDAHSLKPEMLVIADQEKALALAGVIGGRDSGISADTTDILIESANFDPISVRKTATAFGLRTDSVQRFEKGLDPEQCEVALKRAVELILELCPGAKVEGSITDISNFERKEKQVKLKTLRAQEKIGVDLTPVKMAQLLERFGFKVKGPVKANSETLLVSIPRHRSLKDVSMEDDLIEEIARLYGYENIPALLPRLPARSPKPNVERLNKHDARRILSLNFSLFESYNYSFYSAARLKEFGFPESAHIKLANVLSEEQSHLRISLIPNLLKSLREAVKQEKFVGLYEIGRTFEKSQNHMPKETKRLSLLFHCDPSQKPFHLVKGILEVFAESFGLSSLKIEAHDESHEGSSKEIAFAHPKQKARVILQGKEIGLLFTLHPTLAENEGFPGAVAGFELDFEALSQARQSSRSYKAESKFPAIDFDISVLFEDRVPYRDIENSIKKAIPEILKKIFLFDQYEKSLAMRLTLQSEHRTLTGEDLEKAQKSAWSALEKLGGKIRGK